ncbi:MAG: hypothetical protein RL417_1685 [Pseudomonadota bacterium]
MSIPRAVRTIEVSPDELAQLRPLLPRDLIDAQENLDSLVPIKLIPSRVVLTRFIKSKMSSPEEMLVKQTNELLALLARERSYEKVEELVARLGEEGDNRGVQAIRQASDGLVDGRGAAIAFPSETVRG